jgi:uncharacterized membrane protein YphA (DoxX/SURF4 family)
LLLAALFAVQGFVKLAGSPAWVSRFRGWGYPDHFYLVVGSTEILAALLLLIPRLAKFGAQLLIVVMAGAAGTHILHHESQVMTTIVLIVLLSLVLYLRRGATRFWYSKRKINLDAPVGTR